MFIPLNKLSAIRIISVVLIVFILINIEAVFHSYRLTHFSKNNNAGQVKPENLSFMQKLNALIFGIKNPRPVNKIKPAGEYETVYLNSNKRLECWRIQADNPVGEVILFHGYANDKSSMLDRANEFINMGYSVLLVDFMGSGGSEGNKTTIGYQEACQVKTCFEYLTGIGIKNIYLYGTSMGAVAILKAIKDYKLEPIGIIIECPYGTMYQTIKNRFDILGVPDFPFAALLAFWGGTLNGFWAFSHNSVDYANHVDCPTLVLYGEKDIKVTKEEIIEVYNNLKGKKDLKIYKEAGHEDIFSSSKPEWISDVSEFISAN